MQNVIIDVCITSPPLIERLMYARMAVSSCSVIKIMGFIRLFLTQHLSEKNIVRFLCPKWLYIKSCSEISLRILCKERKIKYDRNRRI